MAWMLVGVIFVYAVFLSISVGLTLWLDGRGRAPRQRPREPLAPFVVGSVADEAEEWLRSR